MEKTWKLVCLCLFALFAKLCNGLPILLERTIADPELQLISGLIAIVLTICSLLLVGCLCCDRGNGFKEFNDSPVAVSTTGSLDNGLVNPTAERAFTIFTPLSQQNITISNERFRLEEDYTYKDINVSSWFNDGEQDFPRAKLKYIRELGKGWFGRVVEGSAQDLEEVNACTAVVVRILDSSASTKERIFFLNDAEIYRCGEHTNILKLLGRCLDSVPFLLLQEFCPQGDLKSYLISNKSNQKNLLSSEYPLIWCCQITAAVKFLHEKGIAHSDLACRNCQLTSNLTLKVGDYGLSSTRFPEDYYEGIPTISVRWCAPESIRHTATTIQAERVTREANVWSLGVCFWEVCECGKRPYSQFSDDEVVTQVLGKANVRLPRPAHGVLYTDYIYRLMQSCWLTPESRPTPTQIYLTLTDLLQVFTVCKAENQGSLAESQGSQESFDLRWNSLKPNNMNTSESSTEMVEDTRTKPMSPSMNNLIGSLEDVNRSRNFDEENANSILPRPQNGFEFRLGPNAKEPLETDSLNDSMIFTMRRSSSSETEEENWKTKIERGAYTEKVRQKSRSVTDLMVLTHIDCSESESETPLPSLDHRINYKNVRLAPKNNLESSSYVHGSEGNLLSVQDDFQAELRKLQEGHRDSLFFVPDKYSQNLKNEQSNNNLALDENNCLVDPSRERLLKELNSTSEIQPTNQVYNVFNVTIDNFSPVHMARLKEIINLEEPRRPYEVPKLCDIIQNNSNVADLAKKENFRPIESCETKPEGSCDIYRGRSARGYPDSIRGDLCNGVEVGQALGPNEIRNDVLVTSEGDGRITVSNCGLSDCEAKSTPVVFQDEEVIVVTLEDQNNSKSSIVVGGGLVKESDTKETCNSIINSDDTQRQSSENTEASKKHRSVRDLSEEICAKPSFDRVELSAVDRVNKAQEINMKSSENGDESIPEVSSGEEVRIYNEVTDMNGTESLHEYLSEGKETDSIVKFIDEEIKSHANGAGLNGEVNEVERSSVKEQGIEGMVNIPESAKPKNSSNTAEQTHTGSTGIISELISDKSSEKVADIAQLIGTVVPPADGTILNLLNQTPLKSRVIEGESPLEVSLEEDDGGARNNPALKDAENFVEEKPLLRELKEDADSTDQVNFIVEASNEEGGSSFFDNLPDPKTDDVINVPDIFADEEHVIGVEFVAQTHSKSSSHEGIHSDVETEDSTNQVNFISEVSAGEEGGNSSFDPKTDDVINVPEIFVDEEKVIDQTHSKCSNYEGGILSELSSGKEDTGSEIHNRNTIFNNVECQENPEEDFIVKSTDEKESGGIIAAGVKEEDNSVEKPVENKTVLDMTNREQIEEDKESKHLPAEQDIVLKVVDSSEPANTESKLDECENFTEEVLVEKEDTNELQSLDELPDKVINLPRMSANEGQVTGFIMPSTDEKESSGINAAGVKEDDNAILIEEIDFVNDVDLANNETRVIGGKNSFSNNNGDTDSTQSPTTNGTTYLIEKSVENTTVLDKTNLAQEQLRKNKEYQHLLAEQELIVLKAADSSDLVNTKPKLDELQNFTPEEVLVEKEDINGLKSLDKLGDTDTDEGQVKDADQTNPKLYTIEGRSLPDVPCEPEDGLIEINNKKTDLNVAEYIESSARGLQEENTGTTYTKSSVNYGEVSTSQKDSENDVNNTVAPKISEVLNTLENVVNVDQTLPNGESLPENSMEEKNDITYSINRPDDSRVPKLKDLIENNDRLMDFIIANYESELHDDLSLETSCKTSSNSTIVLRPVDFDLSDSQETTNPNSLTHLNVFAGMRSIDVMSSTPRKDSFSSLRESDDTNLNYSLETWDNFLGDAIDSQNQNINEQTIVFGSLNSEPQSLIFIEEGGKATATPPNSDFEISLEEDLFQSQTINVEEGCGLDATFVVDGSGSDELNKTYDVGEGDSSYDEGQGSSGSWESSGGWFLHPQSSSSVSGQITEQKDAGSYVRFGMDDEILAALRGELLAKLPHAQGSSNDKVKENEEELDPSEKDEVFLRYNVYNTPLSPIPEESENEDFETSGCTSPGSPGSVLSEDWPEKCLESAVPQDVESQSLKAQGLQQHHTLSQDSCCSNDTLFNLEDMTCSAYEQEKEEGKNTDVQRLQEERIKTDAINYFKLGNPVESPLTDLESPLEPRVDKTYLNDFLDKEREHSEPVSLFITEARSDVQSDSNSSKSVPGKHMAPLPSPDDHPWKQLSASLLNYDRSQKKGLLGGEDGLTENDDDADDSNDVPEYLEIIDKDGKEIHIPNYVNIDVGNKSETVNSVYENIGDILNEADYVNLSNLENFKISSEFGKEESGDREEIRTAYPDEIQEADDVIVGEEQDDELFRVLTDIRFSGPGEGHLMSTSFSESNNEQDWDSGSDTRSSSSGEFIWKEGEHEESLKALQALPQDMLDDVENTGKNNKETSSESSCSDDGGECPEFIPSAWDKYATPTKSALRSPEKTLEREEKKKGVWFKKQRYHCVYEYPREPESPVLQSFDLWNNTPPVTSYPEWYFDIDSGADFNEFSTAPSDILSKDFKSGYNNEFFVTSSATPFDMESNSSQFFPGNHWSEMAKLNENTTPDSGVEDITPGSLDRIDFGSIKSPKLVPSLKCLAETECSKSSQKGKESRPGEILGGLRHTRDKLKLDLPPSPNTFTANKTFNLEPALEPVVLRERPSFTTFGKSRFLVQHVETPDRDVNGKNVCFDALPYKPIDVEETKIKCKKINNEEEKGEASLLDSADEDSGIESSTLERKSGDTVGKLIVDL